MKKKNPAVSGEMYWGLREERPLVERLLVERAVDDGFVWPVATGTTNDTLTDAVALLDGEVVAGEVGTVPPVPVPPPPPPHAVRLRASVEIDASAKTLRFID
jgi:hypothetical protein